MKRNSRIPRRGSKLEDEMEWQLKAVPFPYLREHKFHPERKWKFDFVVWNPDRDNPLKCAVEVEGGIFTRGRHVRPLGFQQDVEKYSTAAVMGWCVIRVTAKHIRSGQALRWVEEALRSHRT